jgi:hypothetical protein
MTYMSGDVSQDFSLVLAGQTEAVTVTAQAELPADIGPEPSARLIVRECRADAPDTISATARADGERPGENFKRLQFLPPSIFRRWWDPKRPPATRGMQGSKCRTRAWTAASSSPAPTA